MGVASVAPRSLGSCLLLLLDENNRGNSSNGNKIRCQNWRELGEYASQECGRIELGISSR